MNAQSPNASFTNLWIQFSVVSVFRRASSIVVGMSICLSATLQSISPPCMAQELCPHVKVVLSKKLNPKWLLLGRPACVNSTYWKNDWWIVYSPQMDSVLYAEFLMWKEQPTLDRSSAFLSRIYREDVGPCLSFTRSEVTVPQFLCTITKLLHLSEVMVTLFPALQSCPSWCRVQWKTTLWPLSLWQCRLYRWSKPQL